MTRLTSLWLGACLSVAATASAQNQNFVQGFGGLTLGSAVGVTSTSSDAGIVVGGRLTRNLQIVGEAGWLGNVLPPATSFVLDFNPTDFGVSAWYGQGGLRFTTSSRSGVRPYVETSAGFARLSAHFDGLGSTVDFLSNAGLQFLNRTDPVASAGGGVTFESGRFVADVGYRYRRIFSPDWVNLLTFGDTLRSNEVRVGVGVRF
jgi:opacity protein-like surface antigen